MVYSPLEHASTALPDIDAVAGRYREFERGLASGKRDAWPQTMLEWDGLRRELRTWSAITQLRFDQDTTDEAAKKARTARDELQPKLTAFEIDMKRRFVTDGDRGALEKNFGSHVFRLWSNDLSTFDRAIEGDLVRESKLGAEYTALIAGIVVNFRGERLNLSALGRYASDPDRDVRHAATAARWSALEARGADLDRIYDDLVHLRTGIARKLGFGSFTDLGYRRMRRIDYTSADVARYRDAVVEHVVPVVAELAREAARTQGFARLELWDEVMLAGPQSPRPLGDSRWLMERTIEGFDEISPRLGEFARMMDESKLTDLVTRPGKASGGYCTLFPTLGVPFVFTNFNGTRDDVTVLMHELGHAFQAWSSANKPIVDYMNPTLEAAEVHSMSLEYLSWPLMDRFFGADAGTYRRAHLAEALKFLPYGVAVDHFQHLVYERPDATPDERHAMWQWVERRYLPWRNYGDLARPSRGAFWQAQQHIYRSPFYYIDYTLALCCALQFWAASYDDPSGAIERYTALCARGGDGSFRDLVASAGLTAPFDALALPNVVARAREVLAR